MIVRAWNRVYPTFAYLVTGVAVMAYIHSTINNYPGVCPVSFYVLWGIIFGTPCRTCILALLATALGAVWTVEQPLGSVLEFYPAFRRLLSSVFACGGEYAVL